MKKISILKFNKNLPDFNSSELSKEKLVLNWLIKILDSEFKKKEITSGEILPSKGELAELLGVSSATIQNAIRFGEDMGYFSSKQRIGTLVINPKDKNSEKFKVQKSYSKKDSAKLEIKNLIIELNLQKGSKLPSSRTIAREIQTSHNTVCLALENMVMEGILEQKYYKKGEKSWFLTKNIELNQNEKKYSAIKVVKNKTLTEKFEKNIKNYITNNFNIGDKIPTNAKIANMMGLSLKTVNDIMKSLNKKGIIEARRGKYGTIYTGKHIGEIKSEKSMFMSGIKNKAQSPKFKYKWEIALEEIKKYLYKNCEVGDKIPTIKEFSKTLKISTSTTTKAIEELIKEGFLLTQRGKFGGIFIVNLPEEDIPKTYKWLALSDN